MLFGMIALVGFNTIRLNKVAMNWKNILVMGTMLFLGLGASYVEGYLGIMIGVPISENVSITGLSFAAIVGVIMNAILNPVPKTEVVLENQS